MPRNMRQSEIDRRNKTRRESALGRRDLRTPTSPRAFASTSPTGPAIKAEDPETRSLIDRAIERLKKGLPP